jgi:hypothetical protein
MLLDIPADRASWVIIVMEARCDNSVVLEYVRKRYDVDGALPQRWALFRAHPGAPTWALPNHPV